MNRRSFLTSLLGVAAGAAVLATGQAASAAERFADDAMEPARDVAARSDAADLPAETAEDAQYFYVRRRPRRRVYYYRRPVRYYYRPRRVRYYYRPRRVRRVYFRY